MGLYITWLVLPENMETSGIISGLTLFQADFLVLQCGFTLCGQLDRHGKPIIMWLVLREHVKPFQFLLSVIPYSKHTQAMEWLRV